MTTMTAMLTGYKRMLRCGVENRARMRTKAWVRECMRNETNGYIGVRRTRLGASVHGQPLRRVVVVCHLMKCESCGY